MAVLALLLSVVASLVVLAAIFLPLERAFPARPGLAVRRAGWRTDLAFLLGQYLGWNALVLVAVGALARAASAAEPGPVRAAFAACPAPVQAVLAVLASDLAVYLAHRLQHRVPFLWRFHAVHHSAPVLDALAAHREHPLDTLWTLTAINLPPALLGAPMHALAGLAAARGLWAIFLHAHVDVRLGPVQWLVGSPALHRWHHAPVRDPGNYANLSPLLDLLFGTYRAPPGLPPRVGVSEPWPDGYLRMLAHPFRRRRRAPAAASPGPRGPCPVTPRTDAGGGRRASPSGSPTRPA